MFTPQDYIRRRTVLRQRLQTGLVLFVGNDLSPVNFPDHVYPFRQDSSFLYFWGLDLPGLTAVMDLESGTETVFGPQASPDDIIWTGPQPSLAEQCRRWGVERTAASDQLPALFSKALRANRRIHFLPPYRPASVLNLHRLLGTPPDRVQQQASPDLIRAVVAQRSSKTEAEIEQIEIALSATHGMQTLAMQMSRPGVLESDVAAAMQQVAQIRGAGLAFATIFSVHGEILHNQSQGNIMQPGDLAVNDCGAESALHYAGDITRTIPVGGRFSTRQKEIYDIVLAAQQAAIEAVRPGVQFREIHWLACRRLVAGLKDLGLMRGDADAAVQAGAQALFFPCGLGHMLGLDVHDMEDLGEDYVGYTPRTRRSPQFGLNRLRLARALEPGFVITVEPGVYFNPELIDRWRADNHCSDYIDYPALETYRHFGGVRIEDDVLVTPRGYRILGPAIPRTTTEVEAAMTT